MATALGTSDIRRLVSEPLAGPALERVEEAVRKARRAAVGARAAGEDFVAGAALDVRRHPLAAVALAASAGLAAGAVIGSAAGWFVCSRR